MHSLACMIRQGSASTGCTGTHTKTRVISARRASVIHDHSPVVAWANLPIEHKSTPDQHCMLPCHGARGGSHGRQAP